MTFQHPTIILSITKKGLYRERLTRNCREGVKHEHFLSCWQNGMWRQCKSEPMLNQSSASRSKLMVDLPRCQNYAQWYKQDTEGPEK